MRRLVLLLGLVAGAVLAVAAPVPGSANIISVVVRGQPGSSATVMIWN
jgi:hypothetical protein